MRDDKRRGRGAAHAVIEASSRVQGPSLATVALEGNPYTVTPEKSHARFLTIVAAVAQGAERLAHMNAVDRARAARGDSTNHARRRGRTRFASSVHGAEMLNPPGRPRRSVQRGACQ